ncbi:hypothetical protein AB0F20_29230 [Streptomyces goshikiensis]
MASPADDDPYRFSGGTYKFVAWLARRGSWLPHSVGLTEQTHQAAQKLPRPEP